MAEDLKKTDISELPELLRLAEEVRASHTARLLTSGEQEVAVLSPVAPAEPSRQRGQRSRRSRLNDGWILNIIGLGSSEGPTDVSENKHKYLGEAHYAEFHPPSEK